MLTLEDVLKNGTYGNRYITKIAPTDWLLTRVINRLGRCGIRTISDLESKTRDDINTVGLG